MPGGTRLALAAAVLAASGCGGSTDRSARADGTTIAAIVATHLRAIDDADFGAACAQLSPSAQGDVVGFASAAAPARPPSCEAAYGFLLTNGSVDFARSGVMDLDRAQYSPAGRYRIRVVRIQGNARATVDINGSVKTVRLDRDGGRWRISRLDFSDAPTTARAGG